MTLIQTLKPSKKRKVFVDSSVLIASAISPTGNARELINLGFTKSLELYISPDVLEETERNLKVKAPQGLNYFYTSISNINFKIIKPTNRQILKAAKIIVGKDAPIVAGAVKASADYLVSYDRKHLLKQKQEIEKDFKLKVVTPDELIN